MSESALEILYESAALRAVANGIPSEIRFVSFCHLLYRKPGKSFWGDGFFAKYGLGAIGFVAAKPDWFPEAEMRRAVDAIRPRLARAPGQRLVSYGVSMGGFAALKYAALIGADAAIAFSPQISINPADVKHFDGRYVRFYDAARNRDMRIRTENLAATNYVLYDNFWTVDRKHAERIAALGRVERFALPFTGHASIRSIAEGRIAEPFLLGLIGGDPGRTAELRGMVRRTRRNTLVYWESRAVILTGRRAEATKQILHAVQSALGLAPHAVAWQIALVAALLNAGEREEALWALSRIHLGAETEVGQWVRYIDCHRRIHGDRATIEMMGRAPAEIQSQAAFRFEDAVIRFELGDVASAAAILSLIWPEQEQVGRRMKLGLMLYATGETEKARGVFRALAEAAPMAENLAALAGALAEDRGNPAALAEARKRLAEARKIIDPDPALWRRVLMLYDGLEPRQEQLEAAGEAVAALPGYPDLRMERAIALERAGAHAEALKMAVRLVPERTRIHRLDWLILILRQGGMGAAALAIARSAALERPDDAPSRLQLAVLLLERDDEEEAFQHLLAIRRRPSGRLDLMEEAVRAFAAVGLHSDAAKAAGRLAAGRRDQLEPQLLFADCLIRAGSLKEAQIHLRRVRRHVGDQPETLSAIASRWRRAGEAPRAEELYGRALGSEAGGSGEAAWRRAARMELIALRSQHGGRRALADARRAAAALAREADESPQFWTGLADLFAALDDVPRALGAIGRAIALGPDDAGPRLAEAELLLAAGREHDAVARLAALAGAGTTREIFARAITVLGKARDGTVLREACEARLAAVPGDAGAKLALARALFQVGESERARALLSLLMQRRAGDASFWSAVGDLFLDLKDRPQAKHAAERAIANDPGNAKRANEIICIVGLLSNREPARAAANPTRRPAVRRPGILERLASTFTRS
ncbi:MAG: tetratricopeptide repeat protein [Acetobacteraceae bacterium]